MGARKKRNSDDGASYPPPRENGDNDAAARETAKRERRYLLEAGLYPPSGEKSERRGRHPNKKRRTTEDPPDEEESSSPEESFATRLLGSTDPRVRHAAISRLGLYLRVRTHHPSGSGGADDDGPPGLTYLELLRLWKGLFHGLYMCDKVPVQHELASRIANLMWNLCGTVDDDVAEGLEYEEWERGLLTDQGGGEDGERDDASSDDGDGDGDDDDIKIINISTGSESSSSSDDSDEEEEDEEAGRDEWSERRDDDDGGGEGDPGEAGPSPDDGPEDEEDDDAPRRAGVELTTMFVRALFETVGREWGRMDKYRIDKFYTLIRMVLAEVYSYVASRGWNAGVIHMFHDNVFSEILCPEPGGGGAAFPNGVRLHIVDVVLEELARGAAATSAASADGDSSGKKQKKSKKKNRNKKGKSDPPPITTVAFLDCLEPYLAAARASDGDDAVHSRVMENVVHRFLEDFSSVGDRSLEGGDERDDGDEDAGLALALRDVDVGRVASFLFEVASDPDTAGRYRSAWYGAHKLYVKRIRAAGGTVDWMDEDEDDVSPGGEVGVEGVANGERRESDSDDLRSRGHSVTCTGEKMQPSRISEKNEQGGSMHETSKDLQQKKKGGKRKRDQANQEEWCEKNQRKVCNETSATMKGTAKKKKKLHEKSMGNASNGHSEDDSKDSISCKADTDEGIEIEHRKDKKKKKSRKDKSKMKRAVSDGTSEVVISVRDQQAAARASVHLGGVPVISRVGKAKSKMRSIVDAHAVTSDTEEPASPKKGSVSVASMQDSSKKVQFGRVNRSKSYKASINALRTMDQPSTSARTPDRSILRGGSWSKTATGSGKRGKRQGSAFHTRDRKRAADWF